MILILLATNLHQSYLSLRSVALPYNPDTLASANLYLGAYLLHYIPFFMMGRVLYFHHFYSSFIFNCLLSGVVCELHLQGRPLWVSWVLAGTTVASFLLFAPLTYGIPVDENKQTYGYVKNLKWLETWAF